MNKSSCIKLSLEVVQSMEARNSIMEMLKGLPIIYRRIQISQKDTRKIGEVCLELVMKTRYWLLTVFTILTIFLFNTLKGDASIQTTNENQLTGFYCWEYVKFWKKIIIVLLPSLLTVNKFSVFGGLVFKIELLFMWLSLLKSIWDTR